MQKSSFVDVCLVSKYASGFRNSHWCSVEKVVLKYFAIFTGKYLYWNLFLTKLQAISRIRTEYKYLSVLVSFRIQSECGEKIEKKNYGSFCSLWLYLLISIMKRYTERCALQLYCTSLIYMNSKSKVTENIFNLQGW